MYTEEVIEVQLLVHREVQETLEVIIHQTEEVLDLQDQLEVIILTETDQLEAREGRLEVLDLARQTAQEDKLEVTTLTGIDLQVIQELEWLILLQEQRETTAQTVTNLLGL